MGWLGGCLAALILLQIVTNLRWARRFARAVRTPHVTFEPHEFPPVAVVLTLRGSDPFLHDCLAGLLNQDYPDYRVVIVLDREDDPAAAVVNDFLFETRADNVDVLVLENYRPHCSLKVSALIQAIEDLDPRYEIITVVDADALTYPTWLRDMAGPFADPKVGAATGIRWFLPEERTLPNLIRRQWNISAVVVMNEFSVPWGGSLAIRRSFLDEADQLRRWSTTMCEDTPLAESLAACGYRLQLVPRAVLLNRESIEMAPLLRFVRRQLLFTQLSHPRAMEIQLSGLFVAGSGLLALAATLGLALMQHPAAYLTAAAMVGSVASVIAQTKIASRAVREVLKAERGVDIGRSKLNLQAFVAGYLSASLQTAAALQAMFNHEFEWRGIRYVKERGRIYRLVEYLPYRPASSHSGQTIQSI